MTKKKYELTPEHRDQLPAWRDRWINIALSTSTMSEQDKLDCEKVVYVLYEAAKKRRPERVVFVSSPIYAVFLAGLYEAGKKVGKTYEEIDSVFFSSEYDTNTDNQNYFYYPKDVKKIAKDLGLADFKSCARRAQALIQYGNQEAPYDCFTSFFKDIVGLDIDYSNYSLWQELAEKSGPRVVHNDFCIISDKPEVLKQDEANPSRPHCEDGPFSRWRDGVELYAWHGTYVPKKWVMEKSTIDPQEILSCRDVDKRAAGLQCIGYSRVFDALGGKVIHDSRDPTIGALVELKIPGLKKPGRFLRALCPRNGEIFEGVITSPKITTAQAAQAWREGLTEEEWSAPPVRT